VFQHNGFLLLLELPDAASSDTWSRFTSGGSSTKNSLIPHIDSSLCIAHEKEKQSGWSSQIP
jgi:hypothetical protein